MPGPEKPYRVYRSGRRIGRVPFRSKPSPRVRDGRDGDGAAPGTVRPKRPRRRWGWGRRIGLAVGVLVLLVVLWAGLSFLSFRGGVTKANKRVGVGTRAALDNQDSLLLSNPTDVLLLGTDHAESDARANDQHSDSMMLLRTDPSHHRIAYLSIPRDLRVPIPGHGDAKINAAFQIGGPPLAIRTVHRFTGLPIDHVVVVDFSSFKQLIDDVGGITINVPAPILSNRFDCPYASQARCQRWPGWRFRKGPQHMDGHRALIYSRIRENRLNPAESDVTRAERQQHVVQATFGKLSSFSNLVKAPFKAGKYLRPIATDLSAWELVQLGWVY
ncbi:MAG TPA: LCP family protein, partial [Gaiellaceae bacterium]